MWRNRLLLHTSRRCAAKSVPTGSNWIHEVKYDGYRGRIVRDCREVKLLSKTGLDWAWRFPWIVDTALETAELRHRRRDLRAGRARDLRLRRPAFEPAQRRQLYAFDLVALDGDDLRELPLFERKTRLGKLLKGPAPGHLRRPVRDGEIAPDLFRAACDMRLEGVVSKHRERQYRPRTCDWVKVKNRKHPAFASWTSSEQLR